MELERYVMLGWTAVLTADTLRRVYSVGRTLNDHFVAAVVVGCMGFYGLLSFGAPEAWLPLLAYGVLGIWGLFFSMDRPGPTRAWARWLLAQPSQVAYAFALWGGLLWLLRAPAAWWLSADVLWPGPWLLWPLVLALGGAAHCYGWGNRIERHIVPGMPLRIVQLSDLHASPLMHEPELSRLINRVNRLEPDLVVVTGDLVMPYSERDHAFLIDALARIQAPTFACPGNHDLPILDTLRQELEDAGIRMLIDEEVRLQTPSGAPLELIGVQFHWLEARERLLEVLENLPDSGTGVYRILLAHDPRLGKWTPEGRFDLMLSGHTHGGQVGANMLGLPYTLLGLMGVRDQGWWDAGGARHYVHRGNWFTGLPPRMGVAGEIAVFEGERRGG